MLIRFREILKTRVLKKGEEILGHECKDAYAVLNLEAIDGMRQAERLYRHIGNEGTPSFEVFDRLYTVTDRHGREYLVDSLDEESITLSELFLSDSRDYEKR